MKITDCKGILMSTPHFVSHFNGCCSQNVESPEWKTTAPHSDQKAGKTQTDLGSREYVGKNRINTVRTGNNYEVFKYILYICVIYRYMGIYSTYI